MRNANAQRTNIMIPIDAMRQAPEPHVSHAETAACQTTDHDGQRCALLTTKSRNTCTRATFFISSA